MTATATDLKCERHVFDGVACSGPAEYVLYRHNRTHHICRAAAQYIWSIGRTRCYECRQPIWKHWTTEEIR